MGDGVGERMGGGRGMEISGISFLTSEGGATIGQGGGGGGGMVCGVAE